MSEYHITMCDICEPQGKVRRVARGYVQASSAYAVANLGWQVQDEMDVCPECIQIQKDRAARDLAEEAQSTNGIAVTLEEGLKRLDYELEKLMSPEAEDKIRGVLAALPASPGAPTYEVWREEQQADYAIRRAALRKSFGLQ